MLINIGFNSIERLKEVSINNPEKMEKVMSERIPEIAPKLGLEHEIYTLTKMNNE